MFVLDYVFFEHRRLKLLSGYLIFNDLEFLVHSLRWLKVLRLKFWIKLISRSWPRFHLRFWIVWDISCLAKRIFLSLVLLYQDRVIKKLSRELRLLRNMLIWLSLCPQLWACSHHLFLFALQKLQRNLLQTGLRVPGFSNRIPSYTCGRISTLFLNHFVRVFKRDILRWSISEWVPHQWGIIFFNLLFGYSSIQIHINHP